MSTPFRRSAAFALLLGATGIVVQPASAQVRTVDPSSTQAHSDLAPAGSGQPETENAAPPSADQSTYQPAPPPPAAARAPDDQTYQDKDVFDAAEGVFGKGAEGLAKLLEKVLKEQGRPTAYISGKEAGAAFAVGLRYGSGVMHHKVEGDRPVYWTGPSLGFDFGGNAAKTFVLVYNLYDSQQLFHRFPAVEGTAYFVGGFTASYLRRGKVVLIPIRVGVGYRLGANLGYMKITESSKWMPF